MSAGPVPLRSAQPVTGPQSRAAAAAPRRGLPRLPRGYVEPRAVHRLSADPLPPVVALQAPRGFGKTAALSWLLRQDDDQRIEHVWVNLPHRNVEADEFWETVRRRLRDAALEDTDWAALNRAMVRRRRRLLLVIDDLDRVADGDVDDELAEIAANNDQLHVVAMSRRPRPFQTLAPQLDGIVLRTEDLRLGSGETAQMASRLGHEIEPEDAAELTRMLRGWPALLRIVLDEPIRKVDGAITLEQSMVERYVRLQLTDIHDLEAVTALGVLAVPESLPRELVLELIGQRGVDMLERLLAEAGAIADLIEPEPAGPEPIRAAIGRLLASEDPETFQRVSASAASWFAAHGEPASALRHAISAQEWPLASQILDEHWALLLAEHPGLCRRALERLPVELVDRSARLVVARDYILNLATEGRARSAYAAALLMPDGAARARVGRRLSLRQIVTLHSNGLYDVSRNLVESRRIADAITESGWSEETVAAIPRLLLDWATSQLLANPGVESTYAFCETVTWAEQLGADELRRDATAGAALSHAVAGYPAAASAWLDVLKETGSTEPSEREVTMTALAEAVIGVHTLRPNARRLASLTLPPELADLEVLVLKVRADSLLRQGRAREAIRLLESYRVKPGDTGATSLVEHTLVGALVEAYLAAAQVEHARRVLLEADPDEHVHRAMWALVDFQSGEYDRVLAADTRGDLLPRQTLQLALLRACAALRLQQRPAAIDAFQAAVSTATQTGMVRPFALIPQTDLTELAHGDGQVAELLGTRGRPTALLAEPQDGSGLSPRELQVLEVVSTGASFAAVASRLFVSPNTVKSQMRDIYRKLGVRGREHAVERARELGLLRR